MVVGLVTFPVGASGPCFADIDGDGDIDGTDAVLVACAIGDICVVGCLKDLDGDGVVGIGDLLIVLSQIGDCDTTIEPTDFHRAGLEIQGFVPDSVLDLYVFRIFVQLPEPTDRLVYVYRANVTPSTGSFYQHSEGTNFAPNSDDVFIFPDLEWDSFVTIEQAQVPSGEFSQTLPIALNSFAFNAKSKAHLDGGWLTSECNIEQDEDGKVLVAQLTLEGASTDPADSIDGEIIIGWMDEFDTLHHWFTHVHGNVEQPQCTSDLDGNGMVNTSDLLELFANWGKCP